MMVDVHTIQTTSEVFDLYLKQKSEFHFQQKSDNDFIVFLLDTAVRVISIVQHLSPVIEAVSDASIAVPDSMMHVDIEERRPDPALPNSKRPCLREPNILGLHLNNTVPSEVNTDLIDQQISHHSSEFRQLEKELETLTQSLCEEVALNNAVSNSAGSSTVTSPSDSACLGEPPTIYQAGPVYIAGPAGTGSVAGTAGVAGTVAGTAYPGLTSSSILSPPSSTAQAQMSVSPTETTVTVAGTRDVGDAEMLEPKPEPGSNDTSNSNSESPNQEMEAENTPVKYEPMKIKQELCDENDLENDKNNINNISSVHNNLSSGNNGNNTSHAMMLSPNNSATDQDTERLAAAVLNSVTNLNSVSNFLGSLSQLSMPGPSTQVHPASMTGCKTFDCSFCDYTTIDKMEYVKHIREHTGEKPYTCQICDYRSDHRGNLVIHMRTHTQGRLYHCKLCSFRTSRRMYLHEHMESHAVEEKPYVCLLCDYRTARKANLGIHMGSQKHIASVMKAKVMGQNPLVDNKT